MISEIPLEEKALLEFLERLYIAKREMNFDCYHNLVFVLISKTPEDRHRATEIFLRHYLKKYGIGMEVIQQQPMVDEGKVCSKFHFPDYHIDLAIIDQP